MRLFEFDNPVQTPEMIAAIIKRNCQPFLQATNNLKFPLYRGIDGIDSEEVLIKAKCPVNRKPTDSDRLMHDIADSWFQSKFGIKFRSNSVFCIGSDTLAANYGPTYFMIPIGNFDFCYSKQVWDMYDHFDDAEPWYYLKTKEDRAEATLRFYERLASSDYRCNTSIADFQKGIKSRHEMMIHCRNYYLLPANAYGSRVIKALRKL